MRRVYRHRRQRRELADALRRERKAIRAYESEMRLREEDRRKRRALERRLNRSLARVVELTGHAGDPEHCPDGEPHQWHGPLTTQDMTKLVYLCEVCGWSQTIDRRIFAPPPR